MTSAPQPAPDSANNSANTPSTTAAASVAAPARTWVRLSFMKTEKASSLWGFRSDGGVFSVCGGPEETKDSLFQPLDQYLEAEYPFPIRLPDGSVGLIGKSSQSNHASLPQDPTK